MRRGLVRRFDALIRRILGIAEFSSDPECLLRLRRARLPHAIEIDGVRIPAGAPVIEIHLWNEHLPRMPAGGPDVPWAARSARLFLHSMRLLAGRMASDPELSGYRAVGGTAVLADDPTSIAVLRRLGFTVTEPTVTLGACGGIWKDAYSRLLIWTYNPASAAGGPPPARYSGLRSRAGRRESHSVASAGLRGVQRGL